MPPSSTSSPPSPTPPNAPVHWIQPWHIVLGDTSCRNARTTVATQELRKLKREARQRYFGQKKEKWVPAAVAELQERLMALQSTFVGCTDPSDIGRVLIKCTPKALASGRVETPHLYGFAGDTVAWYGTAVVPTALEFFLTSRDGPQLATELARHAEQLEKLQEQYGEVELETPVLTHFSETLSFFQTQLTRADEGDLMAGK